MFQHFAGAASIVQRMGESVLHANACTPQVHHVNEAVQEGEPKHEVDCTVLGILQQTCLKIGELWASKLQDEARLLKPL